MDRYRGLIDPRRAGSRKFPLQPYDGRLFSADRAAWRAPARYPTPINRALYSECGWVVRFDHARNRVTQVGQFCRANPDRSWRAPQEGLVGERAKHSGALTTGRPAPSALSHH